MTLGVRVVASAVVLVAAASPTFADTIRITSGAFVMPAAGGSPASITLAGDGFTFNSTTGPADALLSPHEQCGVPECMVGTTVDLRTNVTSTSHRNAIATFEGQEYVRIGGMHPLDPDIGTQWDGSVVIPEGFTGGTLTAPFTFSGLFSFYEGPLTPRRLDLFGSGTASLTFAPYTPPGAFPGAFMVTGLRFDFDESAPPVPEPASLLLLGTGLAGIAAARRRRAHDA